ncbi:MAG: spore germination protein [Candidatus Borkfalkiaceae bacterium]|nr:spore germination protein [Christensenellaceae bacterium]
MKVNPNLDYTVKAVKAVLGSDDVVFFEFALGRARATAVYVDSVTDKQTLGFEVISPLSRRKGSETVKTLARSVTAANVRIRSTVSECTEDVLNGFTVLLFEGKAKALSVDLKKYETRAIAEPPTGMVVKGPRGGFTESIRTNLSLVRRYLKSEDLKVENFRLGRYTATDCSLLFVSTIAKPDLVEKVREKISRIDIDGIPDSSYITHFIMERKASFFKQVGTTERPDVLVEKLLEGRVALIVDGSPIVLTLPFLFIEDFQASEDYYSPPVRSNLTRGLRVVSLLFSVFLPALFVSAQLFHLQLIPLNFLLTIVNSIKGIPLSPSFEMFFTLLIFEILNEASVRMPRYVGMALSIVGALVLGETAVNAGIVSTPAILIMALSGIGLYTVPEEVETMSVLRFVFLLLAGSVGGYGVILFVGFLLCYLSSFDNYGVPYLSPYAPLIGVDLQDGFYMDDATDMEKRPVSIGSGNRRRIRKP